MGRPASRSEFTAHRTGSPCGVSRSIKMIFSGDIDVLSLVDRPEEAEVPRIAGGALTKLGLDEPARLCVLCHRVTLSERTCQSWVGRLTSRMAGAGWSAAANSYS